MLTNFVFMHKNKHTFEVGTSFTSKVKLTMSIVSFNTRDLLRRCLASIFKYTKAISFEVIVVDNASTDGSPAMVAKAFPQVKLIKNRINKWYTGANNQALRRAKGKYFLILNSDIMLKNNAFKAMADFLDKNPRVGAVEPLQLYETGQVVNTGSRHNRAWWDLIELTLFHKLFRAPPAFRMKGVSRKTTFPAEVICDAVMMIRTALLKKIGGYDENFKLYYTENDLCRRLQGLSLKLVHLGRAKVWHRVSASTDKAGWKKISPVYAADAKAYYLQYHDWLQAWLLFLALKFNNLIIRGKNIWPGLSLVIIAAWLRFYRLPELMTFIGDQGRDFLAARDMVLTGQWPLVGIPSSVPWLHQGPVFIWLAALALKIGNFHPVAPGILTGILGVLAVYLVYQFSKNWWAGLILATSPLAVIQSRLAYHTSPIPLATLAYLWAMSQKRLHLSYFFSALLLQFELTTLPLTFLSLFWFRRLSFFWLVPFIPKIIYDFSHGFSQTLGFGAWAGYRLVNVFRYGNASAAIFEYWTKFISWGYPAVAAVIGIWFLVNLFKQSRLLILTLGITVVSFYLHGSPSEAYFPVLFPVWALLLPKPRRVWGKLALLFLIVFNLINLVRNDFYPYGPTLKQRLELVDRLPANVQLTDCFGKPSFASDYDNYRYLLWWRGKSDD